MERVSFNPALKSQPHAPAVRWHPTTDKRARGNYTRRALFTVSLLVLVVAGDTAEASLSAFEGTLRSTLGATARVALERLAQDPPDEVSAARGENLDGVVELSFSADGSTARLHCYLPRRERWVDREISFGGGATDPTREASERGRLLGFAVATMFAEGPSDEQREPPRAIPKPDRPTAPRPAPRPSSAPADQAPNPAPSPIRHRSLEFAGIASSGLDGTASGIGASAGVRWQGLPPLALRGFIAGRAGNVAAAQASTRTAQIGAGVACAFLPPERTLELGVRADALLSYFEATHLSEDDIAPDTKRRWLPGVDAVLEGGFRFAGSAGVFTGLGIEAMFGSTEIYTHGRRVAVVPPLRVIGELGFRTRF